ncbi:ABC transporter permease [Rhodovibrio salinarum]|uniref:ABC transmembrane type-1 domain-containing protein n=1 Tax=Rhodovibrio salinarum TaxID=1087 RepID=A0A934QKG0_9PROT|nr:ABC transporter permease [Rhodovibrio salinarum]MBK1698556.1 hypothetical protein [Rhodovibrio salinarum]
MRVWGWVHRHRIEALCLLGAVAYLAIFIVLPYANVVVFSFWEKELYSIQPAFSLDNFARALGNDLYLSVILNSLQVAAAVTLASSLLGYLLAYYLAVHAHHWRNLLFFLLIVPLWTSFLLRAYIWKIILGRNGILNSLLMEAGLLDQPASFLLYNKFSIALALTYIFLPFVALPVYAALEKIPQRYLEASADLGAPAFATFRHVVFPLTLPGLIAGATVVFCLAFGDFITPALLGGSGDIMIANVIISQFGAAYDWPFGSALALLVVAIVLAIVGLSTRLAKLDGGRA